MFWGSTVLETEWIPVFYLGIKTFSVKGYILFFYISMHSFSFYSRDGKILLWDVRHASGCLKTLDKNNGEKMESVSSGMFLSDGVYFLVFYAFNSMPAMYTVPSLWNTISCAMKEKSFQGLWWEHLYIN